MLNGSMTEQTDVVVIAALLLRKMNGLTIIGTIATIVGQKWEEKKMGNKYILQQSIDTYGEKAIIDLFFEESAELTKALLKARRDGT